MCPQQQVIRDFGKSRAKALQDIKAGLPMRGRLVQQQQPGPPQQGADEGDALPLAARQLRGAVSDRGVQAVGQALDEGVELRPGQDVADVVVRRAGRREDQVLVQRAGKHWRVLLHVPDGRPQLGQGPVALRAAAIPTAGSFRPPPEPAMAPHPVLC